MTMITEHNQFCDWDSQSYLDAILMIVILVTALGATLYTCITYIKILRDE
jgi:hypothetical protein